jgi:hypothetical protein
LGPDELLLYLFLVLAADRFGLSFYGYDKIRSLLEMDLDRYVAARGGLIRQDLTAFDGTLFQLLSLPPAPEDQKRREPGSIKALTDGMLGQVESSVKYLHRNFWPLKSFTDLEDVNRQVIHWLDTVANVRLHKGTGKRPLDRFEQVKRLLVLKDRYGAEALRLKTTGNQLPQVMQTDGENNWPTLKTLDHLFELEIETRRLNRIALCFRQSKLTEKLTIDQFDLNHHSSRKIQKTRILSLMSLAF